jgi:hypothetical protein
MRRVLLVVGLGLALPVACAVGAAGLLNLADSGSAGIGRPPAADATPTDDATLWRMPLVDRSGTTVRVWLAPTRRCSRVVARSPHAVEATEESVTITTRGASVAEDCQVADVTAVTVTLPSPLADRQLIDGYNGEARVPVRESQVPKPPAGWDPYPVILRPTSFEGAAWDFRYNRAGAELSIRVTPGNVDPAPSRPLGTEDVGGHEAAIYSRAGGLVLVAGWTADGLEFTVDVIPSEGDSADLDAFRELLRQLEWG